MLDEFPNLKKSYIIERAVKESYRVHDIAGHSARLTTFFTKIQLYSCTDKAKLDALTKTTTTANALVLSPNGDACSAWYHSALRSRDVCHLEPISGQGTRRSIYWRSMLTLGLASWPLRIAARGRRLDALPAEARCCAARWFVEPVALVSMCRSPDDGVAVLACP